MLIDRDRFHLYLVSLMLFSILAVNLLTAL